MLFFLHCSINYILLRTLLRQQLNSLSVGVKLHIIPVLQEWNICTLSCMQQVSGFGAFLGALKAPAIDQEGPFSEFSVLDPLELLTSDHCHFICLLPQLQGLLLFSVVIIMAMPRGSLCLSNAPISLELLLCVKFYVLKEWMDSDWYAQHRADSQLFIWFSSSWKLLVRLPFPNADFMHLPVQTFWTVVLRCCLSANWWVFSVSQSFHIIISTAV